MKSICFFTFILKLKNYILLRFDKNYRLIQFQYKLLMQISTYRYMRHRMKIDTVSPVCFHFCTELETLTTYFLNVEKLPRLLHTVINLLTKLLKKTTLILEKFSILHVVMKILVLTFFGQQLSIISA